MHSQIKKPILSALFAALCCLATFIIKIPSPLHGYIHPGDGFVLLAGWFLGPFWGFLSAGIGSLLADVFAGYLLYAPATFIIKGCMATGGCLLFNLLTKKQKHTLAFIISGFVAELFMVASYYLFEGFLYGFVPALANLVPNLLQGGFGLCCAAVVMRVFSRHNFKNKL